MINNTDIHNCVTYNTATYIVGTLICIGAIVGYIPQLVSLVKAKSGKGISEFSVFLLCLSLATLSLNIFILNWFKWSCFVDCSNSGICFLNLLNVFQVVISWLMATIVYVLFIRFRCSFSNSNETENIDNHIFINERGDERDDERGDERDDERDDYERVNLKNLEMTQIIPQWLLDWSLFGTYIGFVLIVIIISILERTVYEHQASNTFFIAFAYILGVVSSGASFIVWIPQIWHLIKYKKREGLSLTMFLIQAPGSVIVVIFQAVIYQQAIITWMPYAINALEQFVVALLLIWLKCINRKQHSLQIIEQEFQPVNSKMECEQIELLR